MTCVIFRLQLHQGMQHLRRDCSSAAKLDHIDRGTDNVRSVATAFVEQVVPIQYDREVCYGG